jgi:hypothetical protein
MCVRLHALIRACGLSHGEVTMWFGIVTHQDILNAIGALNVKVNKLMTQQDDLNAAAQEIEADVAKQNTALAAIKAEIAALQAANPALDLSGLTAAVADLDTATAAEEAAAPPA